MEGTGGALGNSTQKVPLNLTDLLTQLASTPRSALDGQNWLSITTVASTNMSTAEPAHRSGIVPGIIAASLFISFLLCLYAILWKCMVSMPKRQLKRQSRRRPSPGLLPEKMIC